MNWTGGRLQRHSRSANNKVTQRQKQHFAKARTQVQKHDTSFLAAPFQPNYLQEGGLNEGCSKLSFNSETVGKTSRLNRYQDGFNDAGPTNLEVSHWSRPAHSIPQNEGRRRKCRLASEREDDCEDGLHFNLVKTAPGIAPHSKNRAADSKSEDQLLEVNRERLLKRPDWAGLAPSQPITLNFASRKDKDKIGRRRKIRGRPILRHNRANLLQQIHLYTDRDPGYYLLGATRDNVGAIRVRIGTDAWTSQNPMQQDDHASPHGDGTLHTESSDLLLFDHEDLGGVASRSPKFAPDTGEDTMKLHARLQPEASRIGPERSGEARDLGCIRLEHPRSKRAVQPDQEVGRPSYECPRNEGPESSFRIIQRVGGVSVPMHLVFDQPSSVSVQTVAPDYSHTDYARPSQSSRILDNVSDKHDVVRNGGGCPSALSDRRCRETSVTVHRGIPSHSDWGRSGILGALQGQAESDSDESHPIVASQYATIGDETRISVSSRASSTLPNIHFTLRSQVDQVDSRVRHEHQAQIDNASEELWKKYVFDQEHVLVSKTTGGEGFHGQQLKTTYDRRPESPGARSVAAVSLLSTRHFSTPFDTASRPTSCVSDDSLPTASLLLGSESHYRQVSSPAPPRLSEAYNGNDMHPYASTNGRLESNPYCGFGEGSVTHTSPRNNKVPHSNDEISGLLSGESRTFRSGLDHGRAARAVSVSSRRARRRKDKLDLSWTHLRYPRG